MRLDADKGDRDYTVFHVPTCRVLKYVVWVDDESARWCEIVVKGWAARAEFQAKRIHILLAQRLVLIDPVDPPGEEDEMELAGAVDGGCGVGATVEAGPSAQGLSRGNSNPALAPVPCRQLS